MPARASARLPPHSRHNLDHTITAGSRRVAACPARRCTTLETNRGSDVFAVVAQARWERERGELSDVLARSDLGLTEAQHDPDESRAALAQSQHRLAAVREAATKEVRSELDIRIAVS